MRLLEHLVVINLCCKTATSGVKIDTSVWFRFTKTATNGVKIDTRVCGFLNDKTNVERVEATRKR